MDENSTETTETPKAVVRRLGTYLLPGEQVLWAREILPRQRVSPVLLVFFTMFSLALLGVGVFVSIAVKDSTGATIIFYLIVVFVLSTVMLVIRSLYGPLFECITNYRVVQFQQYPLLRLLVSESVPITAIRAVTVTEDTIIFWPHKDPRPMRWGLRNNGASLQKFLEEARFKFSAHNIPFKFSTAAQGEEVGFVDTRVAPLHKLNTNHRQVMARYLSSNTEEKMLWVQQKSSCQMAWQLFKFPLLFAVIMWPIYFFPLVLAWPDQEVAIGLGTVACGIFVVLFGALIVAFKTASLTAQAHVITGSKILSFRKGMFTDPFGCCQHRGLRRSLDRAFPLKLRLNTRVGTGDFLIQSSGIWSTQHEEHDIDLDDFEVGEDEDVQSMTITNVDNALDFEKLVYESYYKTLLVKTTKSPNKKSGLVFDV